MTEYFSNNIVIIKYIIRGLGKYEIHTETYWGIPLRKKPLGRSRWEDNIKMEFRKTGSEDEQCTELD